MTAYTPNLNLPYPDASDAPCDFAEDWCGFTDAVQVVLDRFEATANRTNPVIPMAYMLRTGVSSVIAQEQLIPFTDVLVDTAGWIDFDVNSTIISPDIGGRLTLVGYIQLTATAAANTALVGYFDIPGLSALSASGTNKANANAHIFLNNGLNNSISFEQEIYVSSGTFVKGVSGIGIAFRGLTTITVGPTVFGAALGVYWHADGPNP